MTSQQITNLGVNGSFVMSGILGAAAWYLWPDAESYWQQHAAAWVLAFSAGVTAISGTKEFANEIRTRSIIAKSEAPSTEHGSAREATLREIRERGCTDPNGGSLIGFKDGVAIYPPRDAPFAMFEMPPGTGKGIYQVITDILHHSLSGFTVFAPDVKCELAPMLAKGLRNAGIETWCINPTNQFADICSNVEVGLYDALIKAAHSADESRKDAVGLANQIAKLHLPDKDSDKSKVYFVGGSRRLIKVVALLKALIDPANCNPTSILRLLNDVKALVATLRTIVEKLEPFTEDDRVVANLKSEAKNLLHRYETNPENFGSFIEWATQVLAPAYNEAGHLADYGTKSTHDIHSLTERPITAFVMTPLSHAVEFESFTSILNANLLSACKRNPKKQRVHLVCDEMLNYRFANIGSDLETMRGLGVTANLYIQSFSGLIRQYGKETAASVNDACDVKVYAGINSYERAKYVSDMLSETTINSRDFSHKAIPTEINISRKKLGRRLMTPDEIMAMPRDQAWVFIKGLRPFRVKMAHYGQIDPMKNMVADSPYDGPPLQGKTLLEINYPKR